MTRIPAQRVASVPEICRRILGRFLFGLALLNLFGFNLSAQGRISIEGTVHDANGEVVNVGVTVRLETLNGEPVGQSPVDSNGHFIFSGLNKAAYVLFVTAKGYQPYQALLNSQYVPGEFVHDVTLNRQNQINPGVQPVSARTDALAPRQAQKEYKKGERALAGKHVQSAQRHFENAVRQFPCYARAQTDLATVFILEHNGASAEHALRKAGECDPDFIDSYIVLGQLLNAEGKFSESVDVLNAGMRRSPGSWQFYYQLGISQSGLKQSAAAERSFEKVLVFNPHPPAELYLKLADVYVMEKAFDKAYQQMNKYLEADPHGRFVPRVMQIMQEMRSAGVLHSAASNMN